MNKYPYYYKRNRERAWNTETYDKDKLFDELEQVLVKKCGVYPDDLQGEIYCDDRFRGDFDVEVHLRWLMYQFDVPKKDFPTVSERVCNTIRELYHIPTYSTYYDISCVRWADSWYDPADEEEYEVMLSFKIPYKGKEN